MGDFLHNWKKTTSEKENDQYLKQSLNQVFNKDLKDRFTQKLADEHGVTRSENTPRGNSKMIWFRVIGVAASIALLLFAGKLLINNSNPDQQAYDLLHEQYIAHPGITKGIGDLEIRQRNIAIASFTNHEFAQAAEQFSNIVQKTEEDLFYEAVSNLYAGNFLLSSSQLQTLKEGTSTRFDQEINWFLGLALLLDNQKQNGVNVLSAIGENDWRFKEAQDILENIE